MRKTAGTSGAVWGNKPGVGGNTVEDTSTNGTEKTHTVHATVASANVTPATYTDTVKVLISY